ncbi:hypothetical protein FV222_14875, partial [Methylobacterium sp. WL103]|uniref:general stress protein n=1 Tax=Methylobacterium sp. WL103 TaxID=2603891 RepID=UPI0011DC4E64
MAMRAITALFDDYDAAARAVDKLEAEGIPHGDISIVANNAEDRHAGRHHRTDPGDREHAEAGQEAGAAAEHRAERRTGAGA